MELVQTCTRTWWWCVSMFGARFAVFARPARVLPIPSLRGFPGAVSWFVNVYKLVHWAGTSRPFYEGSCIIFVYYLMMSDRCTTVLQFTSYRVHYTCCFIVISFRVILSIHFVFGSDYLFLVIPLRTYFQKTMSCCVHVTLPFSVFE